MPNDSLLQWVVDVANGLGIPGFGLATETGRVEYHLLVDLAHIRGNHACSHRVVADFSCNDNTCIL